MNVTPTIKSHARLRSWMALGYALFIMYASLSPFTGWREQGLSFAEVLDMPLRLTYTTFDATVNLMSYLPFGLLVGLVFRARLGAVSSVLFSLCLGMLLSASMEYLQMYLPTRISSNTDLLSNSAGTLAGALLAVRMASQTWLIARLTYWRSSLFHQGKETDFGLALLALWMFGQVNPSLPMLGNVFISEVARQPFVKLQPAPFDWWESGAVSLNFLMLGTLMLTLLLTQRNAASALLAVLGAVALAKFFAAALLLKSWALLLWINSEAMLGMLLGMLLLLALLRLPRAAAITVGATAGVIYFVILNFVLDGSTPSTATSIYHWHYGHLLNYNGLAQTIALTFPILLLFHLWRIRKIIPRHSINTPPARSLP
ncbi:MAG: VanZ family protein [Gallionella sp.]|nr:VanZ family protein [Gallionella sp.]